MPWLTDRRLTGIFCHNIWQTHIHPHTDRLYEDRKIPLSRDLWTRAWLCYVCPPVHPSAFTWSIKMWRITIKGTLSMSPSAKFIQRYWAKWCVKYKENNKILALSFSHIFRRLVSLESLIDSLLDAANISTFSKNRHKVLFYDLSQIPEFILSDIILASVHLGFIHT